MTYVEVENIGAKPGGCKKLAAKELGHQGAAVIPPTKRSGDACPRENSLGSP